MTHTEGNIIYGVDFRKHRDRRDPQPEPGSAWPALLWYGDVPLFGGDEYAAPEKDPA